MNETKDKIKHNWVFTIYFAIMFLLYTQTYIQLAAQLFIIVYMLILMIKNPIINKRRLKNIYFYLGWFGAFFLLSYFAQYWAYGYYKDSNTVLTIFRIFVIGFVIFYYIDTREKAISVIKSFIIGCLLMGIVAMLTTPISQYGKEGSSDELGFGHTIGQHRNNIGAVAASMSIICIFLKKKYDMKYGYGLTIFFMVLTFITGSRSSILQIVLIYILIILFQKESLEQKTKKILCFGVILIIGVIIIYMVPFLHNVVWVRIQNAIITMFGNEVMDKSALGREYYKDIAWIMFLQKPILGHGVDGFKCFLRDNSGIMGMKLNAVYSHCNYAEIAADFGIIGLLIWYIPIFKTLIQTYKIKNNDDWLICILSVLCSIIIFDYSRIVFVYHLLMYMIFILLIICRLEIMENEERSKCEK